MQYFGDECWVLDYDWDQRTVDLMLKKTEELGEDVRNGIKLQVLRKTMLRELVCRIGKPMSLNRESALLRTSIIGWMCHADSYRVSCSTRI